jgi:hypothetical protein
MMCGCRPRAAKTHGHRPACEYFDPHRAIGRRQMARFRRKVADRETRFDHARDVILGL